MQLIGEKPVYSATDLVGFLECEHLANLERAALAGLTTRPMRPDPQLDRVARRGEQHEQQFLSELSRAGLGIEEIVWEDPGVSWADRLYASALATFHAMQRGVDVVYQATFFDGQRLGRADFLRRVERPSNLGDWSYEVWDTKLARHAKASAVFQLCFYSDMLADVQGLAPEHMFLALGGSQRETVQFRVSDYSAHYRLVRREFEDFLDAQPLEYPPTTRPDPVEHCDVCRWSEVCRTARREADDLSLVAGITARQRQALHDRGVNTRRGLATTELPLTPPLGGSRDESVRRVREQARLQVEGEDAGHTLSELLPLPRDRDGQLQPGHGLLMLPEPSPGDLFFDIEGDPFVMGEGLDGVDYLFGVIEPGLLDGEGEPTFHRFWSIDADGEVTAQAERRAFEHFMDLVSDRMQADPNLHIYHYAPYEPTAVKRLMGRHGTREDEVDQLLRSGVFVDLYRAVRQGVRASVESYSIKKLEPLYGYEREIDLRDAGSSIVAFETWLELQEGDEQPQEILDRIEAYNRDDCVSTWKLRDWLEEQRSRLAEEIEQPLPCPEPATDPLPPELTEDQAELQELIERLTADVPEADAERGSEQQARWLLAQLLEWHRREEKSLWWRYFYLKNELTDEERVTESDALGHLTSERSWPDPAPRARSTIYRFSFPPQEHKIAVGGSPHDPATGQPAGEVVFIDEERGLVDLKRGSSRPAPTPTSLIPLDYVSSHEMRQSLRRLATRVADHGLDASEPDQAARRLLQRAQPRLGQPEGASLALRDEAPDEAARRLVLTLDGDYLAIQGPPGSGKSTVGAEMIVDLVQAGKKVGVTATSHKVISQLLEKVDERARLRGVPVLIGQRAGRDASDAFPGAQRLANNKAALEALAAGDVHVVGGTLWTWSPESMAGAVDVLVVDEAGQMSLANALAGAQAAASLVLLGDPQQLDQPLQGVHPPGADRSALAHLLGEHRTMPPELGLFLDGTYRLHPSITVYTSEVFYEGLLRSHPGRDQQVVTGLPPLSGSGIRFVPVEHAGKASESSEEAATIRTLVDELLEMEPTWVNDKGERHPLGLEGILVITPYNAQVQAIREALPGVNVGTVDKFQGQQAPISIYSMATSSADDAPRGMEFLYSLNRLNVATSRARCLAVVVASPALMRVRCQTPRQMQLANALAHFVESAPRHIT